MKLVAIDPGSNKCGVAIFYGKHLVDTKTITTDAPTPLLRRISIANQLRNTLKEVKVVSEEPLLLGRNNNGMQRLLGYLELLTQGSVQFIHPMTLKKKLGGGKLDKLEVALAAGERLQTEEEREVLANAIQREAWDETDAAAIGLVYLEDR